ncbi:MAG: hypothetical protein V4570_09115 [Pseudomonadota bacterium]
MMQENNKLNALPPNIRYALLAGLIAIVINTALLQLADFIPLQTARGGLLKLLKLLIGDTLRASELTNIWLSAGLPAADTAVFKLGFHILIGLFMAVIYAVMLEPLLTGSAIKKGLLYALLVWLVNAVIILPWIGEGFAGDQHLSLAGMLYFAVAHTIFFVALSLIYVRLTHRN